MDQRVHRNFPPFGAGHLERAQGAARRPPHLRRVRYLRAARPVRQGHPRLCNARRAGHLRIDDRRPRRRCNLCRRDLVRRHETAIQAYADAGRGWHSSDSSPRDFRPIGRRGRTRARAADQRRFRHFDGQTVRAGNGVGERWLIKGI
ncbi:hypothetical protein X766_29640 [Mesorhizobium sp. LSJC255A00]|nr:hypothetical protein X766_29640 [Mesorhizobium sp. LSJC255A00]ESX34660.1 hypothetical protein X764_28160 [Mesorhizobium sp. LSHC440A00]